MGSAGCKGQVVSVLNNQLKILHCSHADAASMNGGGDGGRASIRFSGSPERGPWKVEIQVNNSHTKPAKAAIELTDASLPTIALQEHEFPLHEVIRNVRRRERSVQHPREP